jgi:phage shock protein A
MQGADMPGDGSKEMGGPLPEFLRSSSTYKDDLQAIYSAEAKTSRAVEALKTSLGMLQSNLDQVVTEINRVRAVTEDGYSDLETGVEKLAETAGKTTEEFKALVKTTDTHQSTLRTDFQKSHFVLKQVVTILGDLEDQLNTLRTILGEAKTSIRGVQTGVDALHEPILASKCHMTQFENLPDLMDAFAAQAADWAELMPKLEIVLRERLDELGYDAETDKVTKLKPWDKFVGKVWRGIVNNFFNLLGMFLLGTIAWVIQTAGQSKNDAATQAVIKRMEDASQKKDAEVQGLINAIDELRRERKFPPAKKSPFPATPSK